MVAKDIGRAEQKEDTQLLSVSWRGVQGGSPLQRPVSPAPSSRTVVDDIPRSSGPRQSISRSRTLIAEVNLSWWERFLSLFVSVDKFNEMIARRVRIRGQGARNNEIFREDECPFILTVAVYPCPDSDVKERKEGRCVLDTGCFQGNLISAEFATRLGYGSFQPLESGEEDGGIVATGEVHSVLGAVHLTWYHSASGKMFRDMRFLVSKNVGPSPFELVIGTHSLIRDGIISPLNLMIRSEKGYHGLKVPSDREREDLAKKEADLKTVLEDDDGKDETRRSEKERNHGVAKIDLAIYDARVSLKPLENKSSEKPAKGFLRKKKEDEKTTAARREQSKDDKEKANKLHQLIRDLEAERDELLGIEHHSGSES